MATQAYPEPTVGALILNPDGEVLLTRSHKWNDMYVIPGGHIELGERMEDALRREILEETGLAIDDIEFLGYQEFIYDEAFWKQRHFIFFDFVCKTRSTRVKLNDEAQDYAWVPLEETRTYPVEPYTRHTIEVYLQRVTARRSDG
jgi:nucleoside triphosphatase